MGKRGDIVPGKTKVSKGWKGSGAFTMKETVPESRGMSAKRGNAMGSHKHMSDKQVLSHAKGKSYAMRNDESRLGGHTRSFKKGYPETAPCNYHGSGAQKSKELGK